MKSDRFKFIILKVYTLISQLVYPLGGIDTYFVVSCSLGTASV